MPEGCLRESMAHVNQYDRRRGVDLHPDPLGELEDGTAMVGNIEYAFTSILVHRYRYGVREFKLQWKPSWTHSSCLGDAIEHVIQYARKQKLACRIAPKHRAVTKQSDHTGSKKPRWLEEKLEMLWSGTDKQ